MKAYNNPQYALAIKNNLCSFIGFINDIPAFNNKRGTAYNLCVPINHFLKKGTNTFKIIITPLKPDLHLTELSECFASIIVKDVKDNASDFIDVAKMEFAPGTSTSGLELPAFELAGVFEAELPFEDYLWIHAEKLDENRQINIRQALLYFSKFHEAFANKDTSYLFNEIITREKELSQAFYENFEQGFAATQKDFLNTMADDKYILQPLDYSGYMAVFFADGKIISVINSDFEQPIFFLNEEEGYRREFPLYLCKTTKNEFTIIR